MPTASRLSLQRTHFPSLLRVAGSDLYVMKAVYFIGFEGEDVPEVSRQDGWVLYTRNGPQEQTARWVERNGLYGQVFARRCDLLAAAAATAAADPIPESQTPDEVLARIRRVQKDCYETVGDVRVTITADRSRHWIWQLRLGHLSMSAPTLTVARQRASFMIGQYVAAGRHVAR